MNQSISSLNLPQNVITKLENAGFHHCNDVADNLDAINPKIKLPDWGSVTTAPKPKTALELCDDESGLTATLIPELDPLLTKIALPGCITELCGFPGSGKTQLCLHLAVGAKSRVVFIHTNKNLNPERLREICQKCGVDADATLARILCVEAPDPVTLTASVEFLRSWLKQNSVGVVFIDSISWPLRLQPSGEKTKLVYTLLQTLRALGNEHGFTVILTNDLTTRIVAGKAYNTSSFGEYFYHLVNNRILLSKEADSFSASVLKSVNGGPETISFKI
ncbi:DNA repair protein RAD51 homolog 3-like [Zophobas morio]|uniref:DNA repair protein RAD51 homolog 3-like n=1 Tax=Zophobas morio TaxID=2755281 RepID=UPI0030836550